MKHSVAIDADREFCFDSRNLWTFCFNMEGEKIPIERHNLQNMSVSVSCLIFYTSVVKKFLVDLFCIFIFTQTLKTLCLPLYSSFHSICHSAFILNTAFLPIVYVSIVISFITDKACWQQS